MSTAQSEWLAAVYEESVADPLITDLSHHGS